MRLRLRPSGEDKLRAYNVGWPVTALNINIPLLLPILIETNDNYCSFKLGIRVISLSRPSSPMGFLSSTSLVIGLLAR